ncbi:MAG TPA: arginine deiminase family protein [Edaphocola sp.]|nr:arginine deiminase family protein [Edaphocola sp.]
MAKNDLNLISVTSETGTLKRLLVHSPDSGIGKVVPSKAQDWLFEDIVHLDTIRRKEYDYYIKLLLYFLDPEKIKGKLKKIDDPKNKRNFYKPDHKDFHASDKVIELQYLLAEILENKDIRQNLIASVCAIESCSYATQQRLFDYDSKQLAKIFISGTHNENEMIFPPIPNFIFTRDIGITINDHILLNKPARKARRREALLAKYVFFNHPIFKDYTDKVLELPDSELQFLLPNDKNIESHKVTFEGGDVMMVSKDHLLIGVSERTTWDAAYQAIKLLFDKKVVKKITIVKIPKKRDFMHIDTVFTQVKKNVWVMLGIFSSKSVKHLDGNELQRHLGIGAVQKSKDEKLKIMQFNIKDINKPKMFESLDELLIDISTKDLGCKEKDVKIILSGNDIFPYDMREQWTDSCNLLAIRDGVAIGYDRNEKTLDAFHEAGFKSVNVEDLIQDLENDKVKVEDITDTIILMPSAELSRARGGFHCMSMPLLRD